MYVVNRKVLKNKEFKQSAFSRKEMDKHQRSKQIDFIYVYINKETSGSKHCGFIGKERKNQGSKRIDFNNEKKERNIRDPSRTISYKSNKETLGIQAE
jgi:hypothetical protein